MSCMHGYAPSEGCEGIFSIDASHVTFGRGALEEVGALASSLGGRRVAIFTDANVAKLEATKKTLSSLRAAGLDPVLWEHTSIEPTDRSFLEAAKFYAGGRFDGAISLGGGSVIDTTKAALLYATYPASFLTYVNAPVGEAQAVPGALPWHLACPTTSGTGSELTGIAICDLAASGHQRRTPEGDSSERIEVVSLHAKTGIASRRLRPTLAVIDPDVTSTLPGNVVAASGFDVLCHALESYTARPFTKRARPGTPTLRPMSQGANPWSDLGSLEALRRCGQYLARAARDANDAEAREYMMWASSLAGLAFGNSGVHVPHAMAYAVAGQVRTFKLAGYPDKKPMVPHGLSVVINAPAVFRWTAQANPQRHFEAAQALGADVRGATANDAGELIAKTLEKLMRDTGLPIGLPALGYSNADIDPLVKGTAVQRRLLDNAPLEVREPELTALFKGAMT